MSPLRIAVFFLFFGCLPALIFGQASILSQKNRELKDVQRQLDLKNKEIEELRSQEKTIHEDLSGIKSDLGEYSKKLSHLKQDLSVAEGKKKELENKKSALQVAMDQWGDALVHEIRQMAELSNLEVPYFGLSDIWISVYRGALIEHHASFLGSLNGTRDLTENLAREVSKTSQKIRGITAQTLQEHRTRQELYEKKKTALEEVEMQRQKTLEEIAKMKKTSQALTALVHQLKKSTPYHPGGGKSLAIPPHSLSWPVEGLIVGHFGNEKIDSLGVWVVREGVRIKGTPLAPVRSVRTGKVVYAGNFRSYGEVVILEHAEGFFSVYGMLGQTLVKRGEWVRQEDAVGKLGADATLYFELRNGTSAIEPTAYLGRPSTQNKVALEKTLLERAAKSGVTAARN
ncbi:MAG: peptidoglycan DD-metalloendopeptidase family protein [Elusimicrobia bacterium]|nr:peptidoglycan DD-metalloendopeptidase family protein [Elusimicrobiota bacterium]